MEVAWTSSDHIENYSLCVRSQQKLLRTAWDDLELSSDLQAQNLQGIAASAEDFWKEAVKLAETQRTTAQERIYEAETRIEKLKGELSDETFAESKVSLRKECLLTLDHLGKLEMV